MVVSWTPSPTQTQATIQATKSRSATIWRVARTGVSAYILMAHPTTSAMGRGSSRRIGYHGRVRARTPPAMLLP